MKTGIKLFVIPIGAVKGFFSRFGGHTVKAEEKLASELGEYVTSDEEENDDVRSDDGKVVEHTGQFSVQCDTLKSSPQCNISEFPGIYLLGK